MKQLTAHLFALLFICLAKRLPAQLTLRISVLDVVPTTTCTDVLTDPDPLWSINVAGQGWVVYSNENPCFQTFPNEQYQENFLCLSDVPDSIEVCFRAFENDPGFFNPCSYSPDCLVEFCAKVPVPLSAEEDVLVSSPPSLPSGGSALLHVSITGFPGGLNDEACDAIDLGTLQPGLTFGNADTSAYNNYCATAVNEPSPWGYGAGWVNNQAVWFTFTTGPEPTSHVTVRLESDPSVVGDPVNLQAALWLNNNGCTGAWTFVAQNHDPATWGEEIRLLCPQPNTTYYVMVDAVWDDQEQLEGYFGIEVTDRGVRPVSDLRCNALDLGAVPDGGQLLSPAPLSNVCSANTQPAPASAFAVQSSVWLQFVPPASGHVSIQATSNDLDSIDLELAVYASSTGDCTGFFTEVESSYSLSGYDESLVLHCLNPGQTYFLLVDGGSSADLQQGVFDLVIEDGGDDTPVTQQAITLCAGEALAVGNNTYDQNGSYADTLLLSSGCDSIVRTELTVLLPLQLQFSLLQQGVFAGNSDGKAQVSPTGGAGGYSTLWSDGQTGLLATQLIGGDAYCVEVTDSIGCAADTCFTMPFFVNVQPLLQIDSVQCPGGQDGAIRLSAFAGQAPYTYAWSSAGGAAGSGTIPADSTWVQLNGLPAGEYTLSISDDFTDTTFLLTVPQPEALALAMAVVSDASCFGVCDGSISVTLTGGTAPYALLWQSGNTTPQLDGLCDGSYALDVTDAHGCTASFSLTVNEPPEFIATIDEVKPVSCFGGADGSLAVSTNAQPVAWLWSTGGVQPQLTDLPAGTYEVVVTNADGCTTNQSYALSEPSGSVGVQVWEQSPITCHGDANGALQAAATGPGTSFTFAWSNGLTASLIGGLPTGSYTVAVQNERGCEATETLLLQEPEVIKAEAQGNALSCFDPPDGGVITVTDVQGGVAPYTYSADGFAFGNGAVLGGYYAGENVYFVRDSLGCTRPFFADVEGPKELFLEAGQDQTIRLGESVYVQAVVNLPGLTVQWEPAELFECPTCLQSTVFPFGNTLLRVTVTDSFGCQLSDGLTVSVRKLRQVYVPNVFSPDGNGINDRFVPQAGADVASIVRFQVFDRQGGLVHDVSNFPPGDLQAGWDGRHKEKRLNGGVFAWLARVRFIDGEEFLYSGDVMVLR